MAAMVAAAVPSVPAAAAAAATAAPASFVDGDGGNDCDDGNGDDVGWR